MRNESFRNKIVSRTDCIYCTLRGAEGQQNTCERQEGHDNKEER